MKSNIDTPEQHKTFLNPDSRWLTVCLFALFLLAALIRLNDIKAPGHLIEREYTSAIFARAYYFENNNDIEDWRREIATIAKNQQPVLEPPFLEYLVSLVYRVTGREELHYARYLTIAFWLIGGIFLFFIVEKLLSREEALVATTYYLFVPLSVNISRSFQPDSLMMMMYLMSLFALVLYFEAPSIKRLVISAVIASITLLLRPLVIFGIFFSFLALSVYKNRDWKKIINLPLIIFSIISLLPFMIYYGYGIVFAGFMSWKISSSFMPYLLIRKDFWLGWFDNLLNVAEFTALILAVVGFFLIRNRKAQYLIVGLTLSYLVFGIAFTYHIHSHSYYHIQVFPIIGICLAPVVVRIIQSLKQVAGKTWWIPIIIVSIFTLIVGLRDVRARMYRVVVDDPAVAWEIGEIINHSPNTVFVAYHYGLPLEYYAEIAGADWPVSKDDPFYRRPGDRDLSVQERIEALGFDPEYFLITNFDLYNRKHQDLKEYLEAYCEVIAQNELYLIYGSCKPDPNFANLIPKSWLPITN